MDLEDIFNEKQFPFNQRKRQFAPEYSQSAYLSMLNKEFAIGNYISFFDSKLKMDDYCRQQMVMLIEDLSKIKNYNLETS